MAEEEEWNNSDPGSARDDNAVDMGNDVDDVEVDDAAAGGGFCGGAGAGDGALLTVVDDFPLLPVLKTNLNDGCLSTGATVDTLVVAAGVVPVVAEPDATDAG